MIKWLSALYHFEPTPRECAGMGFVTGIAAGILGPFSLALCGDLLGMMATCFTVALGSLILQ